MKRTGARRVADIPPDVLARLNAGTLETVNLMECLAIDFAVLMQQALPKINEGALTTMGASAALGWMERTKLAASLVTESYGLEGLPILLAHPADTVRGWAAGVIAGTPDLSLSQRLELLQPLADDRNPCTRETAWLLMRPHLALDVEESVKNLTSWALDARPNIRRFAVESMRPRGVWCVHIPILKENPSLCLPLLEPLRADPARYVQNSVANWLNDASKTQPQWVERITQEWLSRSSSKETAYICKRGRRGFVA